ncbi:MAG: chromate transporter [Tissierellia bacterium]|nr:chromate transporter [Tissierellia bacterium]
MKDKDIKLSEIFLTFLKISSFTFGGGYTIIPVIKNEFSEKKDLITEDDMMDIIALAQSGPGAMAISTSILTGYRLRGIKGAFVAALGAVVPCIVIISLVSIFYQEFSQNRLIQLALKGMSGAISAILLSTTYTMYKNAVKKESLYGHIAMVIAFIIGMFTDISTSWIILALAICGLVYFGLKKEEDK